MTNHATITVMLNNIPTKYEIILCSGVIIITYIN